MANATLQLNQLVGDTGTHAAKKGGANFANLIGDTDVSAKTPKAFQGLLGSLLTGRMNVSTPTTILSANATTAKPSVSSDVSLEDLLKGLPPELANLLRAQAAEQKATAAVENSGGDTAILDALSAFTLEPGKTPDLVTIIDDPKLAAALSALATQITALQGTLPAGTATTALQVKLQQIAQSSGIVDAATTVKDQLAALQNKTITIADLDGDAFQALKKIAFADLAPFLTQPRNIVVDGRTVMKVAQGPAFLNDEGTDITTMALNAGLVPVLPASALVHNNDPLTLNLQAAVLVAAQQAATANTGDDAMIKGASPLLSPLLAAANAAAQKQNKGATSPLIGAVHTQPAVSAATAQTPTNAFDTGAAPVVTDPTVPVVAAPAATKATVAQTAALQAALAGPQGKTVASDSQSRGFGDVLQSLTGNANNTVSSNNDDTFTGGFKIQADATQPGNSATTLLAARAAGQPHPGTHLVSISLQRNLDPHTPGTEKQISIQMDPDNLGRVRVTLQFGDNNSVKATLIAENPQTLSLLQKDTAALERMFNNSGLDASAAGSISYDLARNDSFSQSMNDPRGGQQQQNKSSVSNVFGTDNAIFETVMPIFVDPATGLTHVNVVI